jgi:hypothetical protein
MSKDGLKRREEAITRFKRYHGNHTYEVSVTLDETAMLLLWRRYYKGRVDISKYGFDTESMKLPLKKKPA